jgi:hypothetical protein
MIYANREAKLLGTTATTIGILRENGERLI